MHNKTSSLRILNSETADQKDDDFSIEPRSKTNIKSFQKSLIKSCGDKLLSLQFTFIVN